MFPSSLCLPVPLLTWLWNLKFFSQGMSLKWRVNTQKHVNMAYHSTKKAWHLHAHPLQNLQSFSNFKQVLGHWGHVCFPKVSSSVPMVPPWSLLPLLIKMDSGIAIFFYPLPWSWKWYLLLWDEVCSGLSGANPPTPQSRSISQNLWMWPYL